ncbi:carboxymethylenebutenolidase [Archangium gephyra]|uniref:Carboxymethylenebutenolidase n=1 Tax=Archangium gephyra TaxID=48 RepID=A0AAC8TJG5_9BACT|nr:dienelactone hydrolase family protein [Archangium gephyra]AKJ08282.1 Dienelactone hydrolase family [Archangium gephyra]REG14224.1 carboxymethylenebutenolidase [Archangium gephyra]
MSLRTMLGCAVLVLLSLSGCAGSQGARKGDAGERREELGGLTEKEFQALHELKAEAAPPRKGQLLEIAGAKAYLSLPENARQPIPGVLVIHEWWGLNEHIMHWADRLAAQGYAALAVDLYGGKVAATPEEAMAAMKAVDPQRSQEILKAAHQYLMTASRVQSTRTGVMGWCFGGAWSLRAGMAIPELSAVVMYYGRPVLNVDELKTIKAPVLGIFGSKDESIPNDVVEEFDEALADAGVAHRILKYDAPHAFANPSAPGRYNAEAAAAAWEQVKGFLDENLKQ